MAFWCMLFPPFIPASLSLSFLSVCLEGQEKREKEREREATSKTHMNITHTKRGRGCQARRSEERSARLWSAFSLLSILIQSIPEGDVQERREGQYKERKKRNLKREETTSDWRRRRKQNQRKTSNRRNTHTFRSFFCFFGRKNLSSLSFCFLIPHVLLHVLLHSLSVIDTERQKSCVIIKVHRGRQRHLMFKISFGNLMTGMRVVS